MSRVKVQFKSHQSCHPNYANVATVNPMDDDIVIDFGFIDPLNVRDLSKASEEEIVVDCQPIARLIVSPTLAKQLIADLQEALNIVNKTGADIDSIDQQEKPAVYPAPEVVEYMEHQSQLFEEKRQELLTQYGGMYVIFEDGQVLDADKDEAALVKRAYAKTEPRHLFIKKVLAEESKLTVNIPSLSQ